ncbi:MAG TPA: radical SAM protein [Pirellulaceae bacterium]|nr:radical SAM protein [Pirellulaceae bacterium]
MRLPQFLQIEPVGQCNLRCQMCPVQFRRDGPAGGGMAGMDYSVFTRLIDQFITVRELHLQGLGEPMMHPRLFDMIEYAAVKGIRVTITTNMTLLSPRRAERCVTSGLAGMCISVDSADPATYERIRVGSCFERVERNVRLLNETRRRHGGENPPLRLVGVLMRQTLEGLPDLVRLADRWSIRELFVQHLCHDFAESSLPDEYRSMRDFVDRQTLVTEDRAVIEDAFDRARRTADELGVQLRLPHPRPRPHPPGTPGPKRCDWPWARSYVSYQGLAMPCCIVATPDRANFGSMKDEGVEAIWNGPSYRRFRDQLASDEPPEVCKSCAVYAQTF